MTFEIDRLTLTGRSTDVSLDEMKNWFMKDIYGSYLWVVLANTTAVRLFIKRWPQIVWLLSKRKQNLTEEDLLKLSDYSTRLEGRKVIRDCLIINLFLGLCSLWGC